MKRKYAKELLLEIMDGDADGFEVLKDSGFRSDGKYELCTVIFKDLTDNKIFAVHNSRTGSYHTDYYYESEDWPKEVEVEEYQAVTKTITTYEAVKNG